MHHPIVYRTRFAGLLAVAAVAAGLAIGADAAYLVLQGGNRVEGTNVRLNAQGDYVIQTAAGSRTYPSRQVVRAEADKPAGYDQAVAAANAGQIDAAITALREIARRNRGLGWDHRANALIARLLVSQGDFQGAVDAVEALPESALNNPDIQGVYWKALLESAAYEKLETRLDAAIRDADRSLAARAQVLRGDIKMKRRQWKPAALDYLRTVALFKAQKEVQPEALYKAAMALEELRHAKADDLFDELIRDYPDSDYAQLAQNR